MEKKIVDEYWYSVNDVLKMEILPFKYRVGIISRIKSGKIKAIDTGTAIPRYRIRGIWLKDYLNKIGIKI